MDWEGGVIGRFSGWKCSSREFGGFYVAQELSLRMFFEREIYCPWLPIKFVVQPDNAEINHAIINIGVGERREP